MITPNSAATTGRAINPTAAATDRLKLSRYNSQTPPVRANGSVAMISRASRTLLNVTYNRTKMIKSVTGSTIFSFAVARSRYSNCPDQLTVTPSGNVTCWLTACCMSSTADFKSRPRKST
ncbi:hypothetical protein SRABI106_04816 [Rahnella aquatilis]|nr:hypothetical protein SRABI106_04816 [Rahnella aquatilis]